MHPLVLTAHALDKQTKYAHFLSMQYVGRKHAKYFNVFVYVSAQ